MHRHRSSTITTIGALIIVIAMGFIAGVVSGNILMRQFITGKELLRYCSTGHRLNISGRYGFKQR